jgi:hypothetical protein
MRAIEQLLKSVALATEGVTHYGRGAKAYSNLEGSEYPRIWVHLINPVDTLHQSGAVTSVYEVIGEVTALADYTADIANNEAATEAYLDTMEVVQGIYLRFMTNLNRHPLNKRAIGQVSRREVLHEYDDNVAGYVFTFTIGITETINYQCP